MRSMDRMNIWAGKLCKGIAGYLVGSTDLSRPEACTDKAAICHSRSGLSGICHRLAPCDVSTELTRDRISCFNQEPCL